jgi:hypothetical protein
MLTREQALEIARAALADWYDGDESVVVDEVTIERDFGWVFFHTSRRYLEGDESAAMAGNAPLIVDRRTGRFFLTGTAFPIEFYIENYARSGDPHNPPRMPEVPEPEELPRPLRLGRLPR